MCDRILRSQGYRLDRGRLGGGKPRGAIIGKKTWLISDSGVIAWGSVRFWKFGTWSSCDAGDRWSEEGFDEGGQQRFSTFSCVVDELEEREIERQLFLGDAAMRSQP